MAFTAVVVGVFAAGNVAAQAAGELRVRLEDEAGNPITGALVTLIDSSGSPAAEALSTVDGRRTLRAPAGPYRVQVRRIGYRPFLSDPVVLPHDGELVLLVASPRVVLSTIVVRASTECRRVSDDPERTATVWEEVRKALRASQLTNEDLAGIARAHTYRREIGQGGIVVSSDTTTFVIRGLRPFGAVDPRLLAREGYIWGDDRGGWEFFGADEAVLLSSEFAATHCFRLVRERNRPGQIGLAFEPVRGRRLPDISGVLWLDEESAELSELRYSFVGGGLATRGNAGGVTRFRRMPSGAWLVDQWWLRMPRIALRPGQREHIVVLGHVETGGGIDSGERTQVPAGAVATVSGIVYDSLRHRPLTGAVITLDQNVVRTGADGRFAFHGVQTGPRSIAFSHPSFSALGFVALEREIDVGAGGNDVVLGTPSLAGAWERICREMVPASGDRRAILHGMVVDAFGTPVSDATVRVSWSEARVAAGIADPSRSTLDVNTDSEGRYVACGFSSAARGWASASSVQMSSSRRDFDFSVEPVVRRDLQLALRTDIASDDRRQLVVLVTQPDGSPLADATVFIQGTSEMARTNDAGRAVLRTDEREVTVTTRRLGFGEAVLTLRLGDGTAQLVRVPLSPVQALPEVVVRAAAPLPAAIERRRRLGRGFVYGPEELEAAGGVQGVLRRTPGASMEGTGQWAIRFRHPAQGGDCWADVYIDGRLSAPEAGSFGSVDSAFRKFDELASLGPQAIHAVEVYPRVTQAPLDVVQLRDGCGAILVWTVLHAEREMERARRSQSGTLADSSDRIR